MNVDLIHQKIGFDDETDQDTCLNADALEGVTGTSTIAARMENNADGYAFVIESDEEIDDYIRSSQADGDSDATEGYDVEERSSPLTSFQNTVLENDEVSQSLFVGTQDVDEIKCFNTEEAYSKIEVTTSNFFQSFDSDDSGEKTDSDVEEMENATLKEKIDDSFDKPSPHLKAVLSDTRNESNGSASFDFTLPDDYLEKDPEEKESSVIVKSEIQDYVNPKENKTELDDDIPLVIKESVMNTSFHDQWELTQQTQAFEPLSLEMPATQDFEAEAAKSARGRISPEISPLPEGIVAETENEVIVTRSGRHISKIMQDEVKNNNDTTKQLVEHALCSTDDQKLATETNTEFIDESKLGEKSTSMLNDHNDSLFLQETQIFTENNSSPSPQRKSSLKITKKLFKNHFNVDENSISMNKIPDADDSIFLQETQLFPDNDSQNGNIFLEQTQAIPFPSADSTICAMSDDNCFLAATQIPKAKTMTSQQSEGFKTQKLKKTLDGNKETAANHDDEIYLQETQLPPGSSNEHQASNAAMSPGTNSFRLPFSPLVKKSQKLRIVNNDDSIFLQETQFLPSDSDSPKSYPANIFRMPDSPVSFKSQSLKTKETKNQYLKKDKAKDSSSQLSEEDNIFLASTQVFHSTQTNNSLNKSCEVDDIFLQETQCQFDDTENDNPDITNDEPDIFLQATQCKNVSSPTVRFNCETPSKEDRNKNSSKKSTLSDVFDLPTQVPASFQTNSVKKIIEESEASNKKKQETEDIFDLCTLNPAPSAELLDEEGDDLILSAPLPEPELKREAINETVNLNDTDRNSDKSTECYEYDESTECYDYDETFESQSKRNSFLETPTKQDMERNEGPEKKNSNETLDEENEVLEEMGPDNDISQNFGPASPPLDFDVPSQVYFYDRSPDCKAGDDGDTSDTTQLNFSPQSISKVPGEGTLAANAEPDTPVSQPRRHDEILQIQAATSSLFSDDGESTDSDVEETLRPAPIIIQTSSCLPLEETEKSDYLKNNEQVQSGISGRKSDDGESTDSDLEETEPSMVSIPKTTSTPPPEDSTEEYQTQLENSECLAPIETTDQSLLSAVGYVNSCSSVVAKSDDSDDDAYLMETQVDTQNESLETSAEIPNRRKRRSCTEVSPMSERPKRARKPTWKLLNSSEEGCNRLACKQHDTKNSPLLIASNLNSVSQDSQEGKIFPGKRNRRKILESSSNSSTSRDSSESVRQSGCRIRGNNASITFKTTTKPPSHSPRVTRNMRHSSNSTIDSEESNNACPVVNSKRTTRRTLTNSSKAKEAAKKNEEQSESKRMLNAKNRLPVNTKSSPSCSNTNDNAAEGLASTTGNIATRRTRSSALKMEYHNRLTHVSESSDSDGEGNDSNPVKSKDLQKSNHDSALNKRVTVQCSSNVINSQTRRSKNKLITAGSRSRSNRVSESSDDEESNSIQEIKRKPRKIDQDLKLSHTGKERTSLRTANRETINSKKNTLPDNNSNQYNKSSLGRSQDFELIRSGAKKGNTSTENTSRKNLECSIKTRSSNRIKLASNNSSILKRKKTVRVVWSDSGEDTESGLDDVTSAGRGN